MEEGVAVGRRLGDTATAAVAEAALGSEVVSTLQGGEGGHLSVGTKTACQAER